MRHKESCGAGTPRVPAAGQAQPPSLSLATCSAVLWPASLSHPLLLLQALDPIPWDTLTAPSHPLTRPDMQIPFLNDFQNPTLLTFSHGRHHLLVSLSLPTAFGLAPLKRCLLRAQQPLQRANLAPGTPCGFVGPPRGWQAPVLRVRTSVASLCGACAPCHTQSLSAVLPSTALSWDTMFLPPAMADPVCPGGPCSHLAPPGSCLWIPSAHSPWVRLFLLAQCFPQYQAHLG